MKPYTLECTEFPTDNSELSAGAFWISRRPTGLPRATVRALPPRPPKTLTPAGPSPEALRAEARESVVKSEPAVELPAAAEADLPKERSVNVVDNHDDDSTEPGEVCGRSNSTSNSYEFLVAAVSKTLSESGQSKLASAVPSLLSGGLAKKRLIPAKLRRRLIEAGVLVRQGSGLLLNDSLRAGAETWQKILSGETLDFDSSEFAGLDEWAADLLAKLTGQAARSETYRQRLRKHGVAAFGVVPKVAA